MCCIKCSEDKNIKFIILYSLFLFARKFILLLLKYFCSFEGTLITTWLMFGAELFIGLCNIFIEYKKLINDKIEHFLGVPILHSKQDPHHSKWIKVLLFFLCATLDFCYCFFINYSIVLKLNDILYILDSKLSPFQLFFTSIICLIILSQKIQCPQIISLLFVLMSLAGIVVTEFFLRPYDDNSNRIILFIFIVGSCLFISLQSTIEKYLMTYDNSTPFQILFYEGIFGNLFMIIISFINFENKFHSKNNIDNVWILIVGFIFYFITSCFLNIYRLSLISSSSPTNITTSESLVIPFIILFSFFLYEINNIEKKWLFLLINLSASFVVIISCLFYNEIIIFSCHEETLTNNNKKNRINSVSGTSNENNTENNLEGSFTTEGDFSF